MMIKKIFKRKATDELPNQPQKKLKPTYIPSSPIKQHPSQLQGTEYSVTCAFVGDKNSGKSNLLSKLGEKEEFPTDSSPLTPSPSINNDLNTQNGLFEKYYAQLTSRSGNSILVTYNEASTKEEHSRFRTLTYRISDVFFLCFSTVDRNSFDNAKNEWFAEIDLISPDAPIYLIGTKCDLRDKCITDDNERNLYAIVSTEEGELLKDEIGAIKYIETDLFNQSNLLKIIKEVGEVMLRQVESQEALDQMRSQMKASKAKQWANNKMTSPCSPKESHLKAVQHSNRRKKESIAVLPPDHYIDQLPSASDHQMSKENTPNSPLSRSLPSSLKANSSFTKPSPSPSSSNSMPMMEGKGGERISLKKLRKALRKKCARKSKVYNAAPFPLRGGLFNPIPSSDPSPLPSADDDDDKNSIKGGKKVNSHILRLIQQCDAPFQSPSSADVTLPAQLIIESIPVDDLKKDEKEEEDQTSMEERKEVPLPISLSSPSPSLAPKSSALLVNMTDSEDDGDNRDYFDDDEDDSHNSSFDS